ncbi:MAG: FAD-dependent oxidoreductase [Pseudomonadota bacterium]
MPDPVHVEIEGNLAWITINNPPVNATSTAVRAGLLEAVGQVQCCDLAVIRCTGRTFVAGGDISEFDAPPLAPHLPDVVNAIERSETPFLAILHGTVLGGGFELAMACAYRVAKPGTRFGLPEVNMGLIPGAGGTQRAPRLLGWKLAVEMACLGQLKSADALLSLGAIDLISDTPETILADFIGRPYEKVSASLVDADFDRDLFEAQVKRFAKGRQGPLHNLEALSWASTPFQQGQPRERKLHLELRQSAESKALRHIFFAERAVAKPALLEGVEPREIKQIAIVGGGLMGSGIAAACLNANYSVTLIERDSAAAAKAEETVTGLLQGALDRGKITADAFDQRRSALVTSDSYSVAVRVDVAIEAVFEDLSVKQDVFAALTEIMRADAILATNTSYLDPNEVFANTPNPERCLGIHFFSPAHIMKLVEVIRAQSTSETTLATGFSLAKALRKTPVLAGICDGFVGNRILSAYRRAAEYLLADGALPHEVDSAMRAFGMAMGPFEAQDQSGLQIALANRRRQDAYRDPDERYVPIADRICAMERFGRRSGAGWYRYSDGKTAERDPVVESLIEDFSAEIGISRRPFSAEQIQEQLLTIMANEGARIVEEGITDSDAAVDVVKTSGYGFPRWRGGPMHWAETQRLAKLRETLDRMEAASPGSWTRAARYQG